MKTSLFALPAYVIATLVAILPASRSAAETAGSASSRPLTIALVGDSTMCDYPQDNHTRGWGQLLPRLLTPETKILNVARGGASTKTFPPDRWKRVIDSHADFVLIQFGHNDSHAKEKPESTDSATDFRDNLRRYIGEARKAGITPVLITPVRRRVFKSNGPLTTELQPYADAVLAVAAETHTPVIDLHALSGDLYQRLGEEGSTAFTLNKLDDADRPGRGDRTHFTEMGALRMAELVAGEFPRLDPRLAAILRR